MATIPDTHACRLKRNRIANAIDQAFVQGSAIAAGVLWTSIALWAIEGHAAQPLPKGTLPVPATNGFVASGAATTQSSGATLTVNQSTPRAVLNWQSFNVASDAHVRFNHPSSTGATLNRIHDANPSVVQGRISANGQVYMINRNGILFDRGAQVNVNTLVASTLDIADEAFNRGLLSQARSDQAVFSQDGNPADFGKSFVRVENGAEITTQNNGRVLLLAPRVENNGAISTPDGQTVLAAGSKVYLAASTDTRLRGFLVEVDPAASGAGGKVSNESLGKIVAERGNVTLVGLAVNQAGRVSATTASSLNGSIVLSGRDTAQLTQTGLTGARGGSVVLGAGSVTEIKPDTSDKRTTQDTQPFLRSQVSIAGETVHVRENAKIIAPSGEITITAQHGSQFQTPGEGPRAGAKIHMEAGSRIGVAGLRDVAVAIERNLLEVDLRGNEFKDAPLQREGVLRNKTVRIDIRKGTPLADVSGLIAQVGRGIEERSAEGGSVTLRSEGEIVLRRSSTIDVSGGNIAFSDGYLATSKLFTPDGKLVDIGAASPERIYAGIADEFVARNDKFGRVDTFKALTRGEFAPGYKEGRNAGTVTVSAHHVVFDGDLKGMTVIGPLQNEQKSRPLGGQLILGDASQQPSPVDFKIGDIRLLARREPLPADYRFEDILPESWARTVVLPTSITSEDGFSRLTLLANGAITLPAGERLDVGPWGRVELSARSVAIDGTISIPSGIIIARTRVTAARDGGGMLAPDHALSVGANARLSTAGSWINESPRAPFASAQAPHTVNGGSITLSSAADVRADAGSLIDVSGGARLSTDDRLTLGSAGAISITTGRFGLGDFDAQTSALRLEGELRAIAPGAGGTLTIDTSKVRIGATPRAEPAEFAVTLDRMTASGIRKLTLTGQDGLVVAQDTNVPFVAQALVLGTDFALRESGTPMSAMTTRDLLPQVARIANELTLNTGSRLRGDMHIEPGAVLEVDPGGRIAVSAARQLTVDGRITAPAGQISLSTNLPSANDAFIAGQSIWLGARSVLDARGVSVHQPNRDGLLLVTVRDGGAVTINAASGYVIAARGARIDVSGTSSLLDVPTQAGARTSYDRRAVSSAAGAIEISAREGVLLDGTLASHGGGGSSAGGTLAVTLERATLPLGYPIQGPRSIVIAQDGAAVPAGLRPGEAIPAQSNGVARVHAARITEGGFHRFSALSENRIQFEGDVGLTLARSISLDAPEILGIGSSNARLLSGYIGVGNFSALRPSPASVQTGTATLDARAAHIDFIGDFVIGGFSATTFAADGDIQLRGVVPGPLAARPEGMLRASGDLTIKSRQLYPTTRTRFRIEAPQANATLTVLPNGRTTPVMSADGILTLRAHDVRIAGAVKAPFGEIVIDALDRLTLENGSVVSVAAQGEIIPFGATELSGRRYVYPLADDNRTIITTLADKRVELRAPVVVLDAGANIDLSGGGDLFATEFLPGTGGSRDVLDPANAGASFAILPTQRNGFGPADPYYALNVAGTLPGDAVAISSVPGLADGIYTILPARYALLPGAYWVTPVAGTQDLVAAQSYTKLDGSVVVPGYRVAFGRDGVVSQAARSEGFNVRPGSSARVRAEYRDVLGSVHFSAAQSPALPADAGRLVVEAGSALSFDADVRSRAALGGRGSAIDITAPRIAVTASPNQNVDAGLVRLDADRLNALGASSLLIGGVRRGAVGATFIDVATERIVVANDADSALRAPELLLVAREEIRLRPNAVIEAQGALERTAIPLVIGQTGGTSGDGAMLRAAAGSDVELQRINVARARGVLNIEHGARVSASGAIMLDATRDTVASGQLVLDAGGALSLGAGRISIGGIAGITEGLAISNTQLRALGVPGALSLRSYTSVDFHGPVELGDPTLARLTVASGGIGGYGAGNPAVRVTARQVTLGGGDALAFSPPPPHANVGTAVASGGHLHVGAERLELSGGSFELHGFANVDLVGASGVRLLGEGQLTTDAALNVSSARLDAADRARFDVRTTQSLALLSPPNATVEPMVSGIGAALAFLGRDVTVATAINAPSGRVRIEATGTGPRDDARLLAGSNIAAAGRAVPFEDTIAATPGGRIELVSAAGDVSIGAGATLDVSAPAGMSAGALDVLAPRGRFSMAGLLIGGSAPTTREPSPLQSAIRVDAGSIEAFSALQSALNPQGASPGQPAAQGFTGERRFRVRDDDIALAAGSTMIAREVSLSADTGAIDIRGTIDASAPSGGRIEIYAGSGRRLDIGGGAHLDARATAQAIGGETRGGHVTLGTGAQGTLALAPGSVIHVGGADGGAGKIVLRAPRVGNDVAIDTMRATLAGSADVVIEAYRIYDRVGAASISSLGTSAAAGRLTFNQINSDNNSYLSNANITAMRNRLGLVDSVAARYTLGAGVEVRAPGTLTLAADWDLRTARPGNQPGVLTLRAAGDLLLSASLSDGFSNATSSGALQSGGSWSYRVTGGADLAGADPLAVRSDGGNVEVGAGRIVRTGSGDIYIAAGRDVLLRYSVRAGTPATLNVAPGVVYTAGTVGPTIADFPTITINSIAASFPTRGGDLRVSAGRDIAARSTTATDIATAPITQFFTDWLYRQGSLATDGTVNSFNAPRTAWWPRFADFRQGFGALGGGHIDMRAARDIDSIAVAIPTNGRLGAPNNSVPDPDRLVVQGGGDVRVHAGNNIDSTGFLVGAGNAHIHADGRIGASRLSAVDRRALYSTLLLGEGTATITSGGDLSLETIASPTAIEQVTGNFAGSGGANRRSYFFTYGESSRASLVSSAGSVNLVNDPIGLGQFVPRFSSGFETLYIYPSTLQVAAPLGDINVGGSFELFPAPLGTLDLLAGQSITASGRIGMVDAEPARLPGVLAPDRNTERIRLQASGLSATGADAHANPGLHRDDPQPVRIIALNGDVTGVVSLDPQGIPNIGTMAILPKRFVIIAGRDVRDAWVFGQNLNDHDVSRIQAGRDFRFSTVGGSGSRAGIELGGPGALEIHAGRDIDLGDSRGVTTRGNLNNPTLPEQGASISLIAGATRPDFEGYLANAFRDTDQHNARLINELIPYIGAVTGSRPLNARDVLDAYRGLPDGVKSLFYRDDLRKTIDKALAALSDWEALSAAARATSGTTAQAIVLPVTRYFPSGFPIPQSSLALDAFSQILFAALASADSARFDHRTMLDQARELPQASQHALVRELLFTRLKDTGRAATRSSGGIERYDEGYRAIADLFPANAPQAPRGDLNLFFSQVKTEQGGDIAALVPAGLINAGLASIDGSGKAAADLGILTIRGGSIRAAARDDFLVNQSRVFTLQGGDILLWSSTGNIDAGKGAKSATATPPPQVITRGDQIVLDISNSVSGSGIGVLLSREGIAAGDVDLIAPRGEVNAGEAPIRAAGNINIAAERVVGADNIQVGGTASGVALQAAPSLSAAVAATSNPAGEATRSAEQATRSTAGASASSDAADAQRFRPTFLTVEVLGLGDDGVPSPDERTRR